MKNQQIVTKIKQLILPLLDSQGVEFVDIELKGGIGNQVLRIYVDVDGGINLNHCVAISRKISDILDIEDIMPGRYRLEVSSPGTNRPLKTVTDFRRNIGRNITLRLLDGNTFEGSIKNIDNSNVYLEKEDNQLKFPLSSIKLAKLRLQW